MITTAAAEAADMVPEAMDSADVGRLAAEAAVVAMAPTAVSAAMEFVLFSIIRRQSNEDFSGF